VNVATGIDISVRDVAAAVIAAVGVEAETVLVEERLGQVDRHIGSTDKLAALTGWRARTSFEQGLERTVAWYRDNEVWWRALTARDSVSSS
jgi:nucleoside-diphosphate-sugar epimerase